MIVKKDELQILFNLFPERLEVKYPIYDFNILEAFKKDSIKIKLKGTEEQYDKFLSKAGDYSKEFPGFADIRNSFLVAGIMDYKNKPDLIEQLNVYSKIPNKAPKFCLDTNLLYNRFFSNTKEITGQDIVLIDTVEQELNNAVNKKYESRDIKEMVSISNNKLLNEFHNRRIKGSRQAGNIAILEKNKMLEKGALKIPGIREPAKNSRENDAIIVESVRDYSKKNEHVLPVFITGDDGTIDLCKQMGVSSFKLDTPNDLNELDATPNEFVDLIFSFATIFGAVKVNSITIFGEFKGKSSNEPDTLKLSFHNPGLEAELEKEVVLCRKLNDIGFLK